jgi:hypothetical protein
MAGQIIAKDMDSELMLYETEKDSVHVLNPTARMVYHLHKTGRNRTEMEQEMRKRFQVDTAHDLLADVTRCLEELRSKQLIGA